MAHNISDPLIFEALFRPFHLALLLALFALMVCGLDKSVDQPIAAQGLSTGGQWFRESAQGIALGVGLVSLAVALIAILGSYHLGLAANANAGNALLVIWTLLTAAMLEEVSFRGYPFQRLIEAIGPAAATVAMSALFGMIHLGNPHATKIGALNTALVGMLFSVAYLKTRRLWLSFGIHFGWNAAMGLIFGLPVSGLNMFSVVLRGQAAGPEWLTGGDYGIEASLTGTFVIVCGTILLAFVPAAKGNKVPDAAVHETSI